MKELATAVRFRVPERALLPNHSGAEKRFLSNKPVICYNRKRCCHD